MIPVSDHTTIGEAFDAAVAAFGSRPFLEAPSGVHRPFHPAGYRIDFAGADRAVAHFAAAYRSAGLGHGHRVGLLLDNRPEHFLIKLALARIGATCVPINPDYRAGEIAFLLAHAEVDLVLVAPERQDQMTAGMTASTHKAPVALFDQPGPLPRPTRDCLSTPVTAESPASILYTSGTTGRPKGCILSHGYELASGTWYATRGGLAAFRPEGERIYNPLPVYHVNASVVSFFAAMLTGGCQIQTDRFHPARWWPEVRETRATIVHYLGVIVPMLLGQPPETGGAPTVRFGIGAGVEPQLHSTFEQRFGFPLLEVWGMTEMVRVLIDNEPPRQVGTRAFGRPVSGVEVRVVDADDRDVPQGAPGEMVIRHSRETPRKGFFSGYLKDQAATTEAWRGGWFHTGDTVRQSDDGMLHFIDRKKNIIRRSGENIAAAEVEALLQAHPLVKAVAVLAVADEVREEEVLAVVALHDPGRASQETAQQLFAHCHRELAYFKAPGWMHFVARLPTTGTQKIQKHSIYPAGIDPRLLPEIIDLRVLKRRSS